MARPCFDLAKGGRIGAVPGAALCKLVLRSAAVLLVWRVALGRVLVVGDVVPLRGGVAFVVDVELCQMTFRTSVSVSVRVMRPGWRRRVRESSRLLEAAKLEGALRARGHAICRRRGKHW